MNCMQPGPKKFAKLGMPSKHWRPHKIRDNMHPIVRLIFEEANFRHLTILDIAKASGVSNTQICDWRDRYPPRLMDLEAVLNALGLKLTVVIASSPTHGWRARSEVANLTASSSRRP